MTTEEYLTQIASYEEKIDKAKKVHKIEKRIQSIGNILAAVCVIVLPCLLLCLIPKSENTGALVTITPYSYIPLIPMTIGIVYFIFGNFIILCLRNVQTRVIAYNDSKIHRLSNNYLCERFSLTQEQLDWDLTGIINAHPGFKTWWQKQSSVAVVEKALNDKYHRYTIEQQTGNLKVENLKLQNESIAIDNTQKKLWTCPHCGNVNRADDLSCISCGGNRILEQ